MNPRAIAALNRFLRLQVRELARGETPERIATLSKLADVRDYYLAARIAWLATLREVLP
jgi:hypothetical protein